MKYSEEFKAHIKQPGLNEDEFYHLVRMVQNKTEVTEIYAYLQKRFKDPRTVQKWMNKALIEAKKLPVDKGE